MNAVRKYKWKIEVTHNQPHPVLEHLAKRTFELESLDPPPEVGQTFILLYDDYRSDGAPPSDRCVEIEVVHRKQMMMYSNGQAHAPDWFMLLYARIAGKADLPW